MGNLNTPFRVCWDLGARQRSTVRELSLRNDLMRAYRAVGANWWRSRCMAAAEIAAARFGVYAVGEVGVPRPTELAWNRKRKRR